MEIEASVYKLYSDTGSEHVFLTFQVKKNTELEHDILLKTQMLRHISYCKVRMFMSVLFLR